MRMYRTLSSWHLMVLLSVLYLIVVWMMYQQVVHQIYHYHQDGKSFKPRLLSNGSFQFFFKECPIRASFRHSQMADLAKPPIKLIKPGTCSLSQTIPNAEIQMEEEWSQINVKYPQYVYTVTGWIQVLSVPNYSPKPLHVIIVPHSHQDPGWKDSFVGYYSSFTKRTISHIVDKLTENPTLKFIWSEIVFLHKWYYEPDSKREKLHRLIRNGQLEIVTGGWVMTDEAVTHYSAMVNQLIDGHLWLKNTFGIVPNTSWSVDPFGHSPTMTYMLKRAGINKMVIQRTHFGIKRHFAKRQDLEFLWRQIWDATGDTDVLCHMMPFLSYAISYSCGPDPHVCCQFDFHLDRCFRGTEHVSTEHVNDKNIKKLSWALWEQFQKKAQLYQSNALLVPHGDDFRYSSHNEWNAQFGNLDKLIKYMNNNEDMNIQIEYGTVSDYFKVLEQSRKDLGFKFPTLSGDFLPYNDRDDQYWTGYYSVRPLHKNMVRVLQGKLRIAEILFILLMNAKRRKSVLDDSFYINHRHTVDDVRQAVSLFHHHDAITGTSKRFVMEDYHQILKTAMERVDALFVTLVDHSLVKADYEQKYWKANYFTMAQPWLLQRHGLKTTFNHVNGNWLVVVTNPLTVPWKSAVTVRTKSAGVIRTMDDVLVRSQINPVLDFHFKVVANVFAIVFEADLEPLSVKTYKFVEQSADVQYAQVTVYGKDLETGKFMAEYSAQTSMADMFDIENHLLQVSFSSCTGTLQYIKDRADYQLHKTAMQMVTYGTGSWSNPFRDKSGAYIFMPDGPARTVEEYNPPMVQIEGPIMSSVTSKLSGIMMTATVYNISGPVGAGVHLDNLVDIGSKEWDNQELAVRIISDVESPDTSICVDLNGFQMHRKKLQSKLLIQGNFHPVTSAAFIEDGGSKRLTLLTSEAHGVASLHAGWLEVVLDRRMMQDDWRGLNEGPHDNTLSPSHFILIPEKRNTPSKVEGSACHLSLLAQLLSDHLNNLPPVVVSTQTLAENYQAVYSPTASFLAASFPCQYRLVHMRYLEDPKRESDSSHSALMVLHRLGMDCSFDQVYQDCELDHRMNLDSFKDCKISQATETSLTGVQDFKTLNEFTVDMKAIEMKTVHVSFHH